MLSIHRHRALLFFKGVTLPSTSTSTSPTPIPYPLFHHHGPSPFSLHFCTDTCDSRSFAMSYLIHNFGFSTESASKACSSTNVRFKTAEKPESVISFFRSRGFSNSQLHSMITKAPWLLSCDPSKRLLPKFEFFLSKGTPNSEFIDLVSRKPAVLAPSLENQIVPNYELLYRFLQSDKHTVACVLRNPNIFGDPRVGHNIRVLIENGVTDSNIARLLRTWSRVFNTGIVVKVVEELKDLGFDPSKSTFCVALIAKKSVSKTRWKEKVGAFKKWGWSDKDIRQAFRKRPHCMLASVDKINLVMNFWVKQLGWNALALAKNSMLFGLSLETRIIPRASVVQFLLKKGLRKENASLTSPFAVSDKVFLDKFIGRFKEDSSDLLKLYEEKLNLAYTGDKTGMS